MRAGMFAIIASLVTTACVSTVPVARAPSDAARIAEVQVRPDVLSITMTDGARCIGTRPDGVNTGWSGTMDNCGYALPYTVTFHQGGSDADRFLVEEAFGAVADDGALVPRADVYVQDVDGVQKQFIAPLENVRIGQAPAI